MISNIHRFVAARQSKRCKKPAPNCSRDGARASHVEAEMEDVAVLDGVVATLEAHLALLLGLRLAATGDEILGRDGLGGDEAALEIRMDHAGGLGRFGAAPHG